MQFLHVAGVRTVAGLAISCTCVCACERERQGDRETYIHTYIHIYIQTDRPTDRQSGEVGVGEAGWGGDGGRETDMERAVQTGQARTRGEVPHLRGLAGWEDHE